MELNQVQFAEELKNNATNQFAGLVYVKDITTKCVKKCRETKTPTAELFPNGLLIQQSYRNISQLGIGSYQNAVNNAKAKQEQSTDFESQGLPSYLEQFDGSKVILRHVSNGNYYIRLRIPRNCKCEVVYFDRQGTTYTYDEVKSILPNAELKDTKTANAKSTADRQGVEVGDSVKPRNYIIANIARLAYGGVEYTCTDAPPYRPAASVEGGAIEEREERREEEREEV
jgi:hypothetical protein